MEDDFKELPGGDIMAERYRYKFIIWEYGNCFIGVCKNIKRNREMFRFQTDSLSKAKMLCKEHKYWNR